MALLRTFTCTPGPDVVREVITGTTLAEFDVPGMAHVYNRSQRPAYKFHLKLGPLTRQEVESLSAFHAFHQGAKSFMWDGGPHGAINNFNLIGEGVGNSQREFFLPNRNIGAGSISIRTVNQVTQATSNWAASSSNSWPYSLNPGPGIIMFANSTNTIPASGHDVHAIYGCRYRVFFSPDGIRENQIAAGLWTADIELIETALLGNV